MIETAVIIAGLICITVLIVALMGFLILRSRKRARDDNEAAEALINKLDEAANVSLTEINKTSRLVLDEIETKYQAMLFLYNLLEEKKKEIAALVDSAVKEPTVFKRQSRMVSEQIVKMQRTVNENTRNKKINDLHQNGLSVAEIAKKLNIGQGEVQLILNLSGR